LSLLTVLVRESAQNAWDAKVQDTVTFRLDLNTVGPAHHRAWAELLEPGLPGAEAGGEALTAVLRRSAIRYIAVSDRGTRGLGGPTRSDRFAEPGDRNWLSFVLNSGEKQDTDGGGGTYGYGKGAFFLASKVGMVLIHSRFRTADGTLRTRLIASALWHSYTAGGKPFTGRHWWGNPEDDHCEPLIDAEADDVARRLGLMGFAGDETGTTVVVLDPDLADPTVPEADSAEMPVDEAGRYLADAAGWNLWPIMLEERPQRMAVTVTAHGTEFPVPSASNDATIAHFAAAYREARRDGATEIRCGNPKELLGHFGNQHTFGASVESPAARELGLDGAPHHVCLLRRPDLVVRYLEGPPREHPTIGYVGVFKVVDDLDVTFSRAEPPTHDAWIDSQLQGREATYVRVAHRRLKDQCADLAGPRHRAPKVGDHAVGSVAQRLGHLLAGPGGSGVGSESAAGVTSPDGARTDVTWPNGGLGGGPAGDSGPTGGSGGTGQTGGGLARPVLVGEPTWEEIDGRVILVQPVRLRGGGPITGRIDVVTGDGSAETTAPAGSDLPEIHGWRTPDGVVTGAVLHGDGAHAEVELLVVPVPDAVLSITVRDAS
jgi:hypothetical protein